MFLASRGFKTLHSERQISAPEQHQDLHCILGRPVHHTCAPNEMAQEGVSYSLRHSTIWQLLHCQQMLGETSLRTQLGKAMLTLTPQT